MIGNDDYFLLPQGITVEMADIYYPDCFQQADNNPQKGAQQIVYDQKPDIVHIHLLIFYFCQMS